MTGAGFCGSLTSGESPDIDWQPIEKGRHSDPFLFDLYLYFTSLSITQPPFGAKCKWFIQIVLHDFFAGEGLTTFDTRQPRRAGQIPARLVGTRVSGFERQLLIGPHEIRAIF